MVFQILLVKSGINDPTNIEDKQKNKIQSGDSVSVELFNKSYIIQNQQIQNAFEKILFNNNNTMNSI